MHTRCSPRWTIAVVLTLGIATGAHADVPSPPPSSCPRGARPREVAHYASWCEATTCRADGDCAPGESCGEVRGLCVRDRDVAGVGWASGHTQRLHEALSTCAAQSDCPSDARCELVARCDQGLIAAMTSAGGGTVDDRTGASGGYGRAGLALIACALLGLAALAALAAVVVVVWRRKRRPPPA